ncbi:MAG: hypothetical protein S4CHLAM7_05390 [Chlamydiae bacterium]|nr:hypothetical protein [Chlamydiota bacterium]
MSDYLKSPPLDQEDTSAISNTKEAEVSALSEEEQRVQFERLLEAFEQEMEQQITTPPEEEFNVPAGLEHYLRAPLNVELLERDYAIWKRLVKISGFIFTQSAIQFQGISKSSMILGSVMGILMTKYLPLTIGGASMIYSSYRVIANGASIILGSDSMESRYDLWNSAKNQDSIVSSLYRRIVSVIGTDSAMDRVKSALWGGIHAYVAYVGKDFMFGQKENDLTKRTLSVISTAQEWILPTFGMLASGGISYFGMMCAWMMNGEGVKKLNSEFIGLGEDFKFANEFDRLSYISDEEYKLNLTQAMNVSRYDQINILRNKYQEDVKDQIKSRNYPHQDKIDLNSLEMLKKMNAVKPEDALKPVLTQMLSLKKEKEATINTYKAILDQGLLHEAQKILNQDLKPMLFKLEFLRQTILDPARPPLGMLMDNGAQYYSYVSLLAGSEIKWDLKATDPDLIEEEARELFLNESAIHKILCFEKGKEQITRLQEHMRVRIQGHDSLIS